MKDVERANMKKGQQGKAEKLSKMQKEMAGAEEQDPGQMAKRKSMKEIERRKTLAIVDQAEQQIQDDRSKCSFDALLFLMTDGLLFV